MATIAKGMITLVNVNDAYTVSATPNVCAIKADFDGTNPVLDEAYSDITVVRGDVKVPFTINSVTPSNDKIEYEIAGTDATKRLIIKSIPTDALSGTLTLEVATEDEFVATVIFQYSVMRESTMLDWIKDWENNKTTIGSTYLITPKLFVGKKITNEADMSVLTGVYIGPDSDNGAGIYGYKQGEDIFHINEHGGLIGGWEIAKGGIQTSDGTLKILSEGSIISSDADGNVIWGLYKSGNATFAKGNVKFHADGSAEFAGTIKASDGVIGGWYIGEGVLRSNMMCLDANNNYIGVSAQGAPKEDGWDSNFHKGWVARYGGVAMYYDNASFYGLIGYLPQTGIDGAEIQQHKVFSLGSENLIAGWNFDDTAIWTGNKMNTAQQYTSESGSITLGTNGLRGYKWFIDSNGDVSFMGGKIKFTASNDGGEIVGWKLNPNRLSTNNVALVSDGSVTGLYMSAYANANFNSRASTALENYIDANGGIYMNINDTGAEFAAYDLNGKKLFKLKSDDVSSIAGWNFNNTLLYTGTPIADVTGFTASADSISISPVGIFGYKWRLCVNGDGAVAGGNISWDDQGNVTFADSVKIGWNNLGGTIINSEGVFAGKISADNITAGTISTANIKNATGTWQLNQDGTGQLANGKIKWDNSGSVELSGKITANSGKIGYFDINSSGLYYGDVSQWQTSSSLQNLASLYPGTVLLQRAYSYAGSEIAKIKVGLGEYADPNANSEYNYCECAAYFFRRMNGLAQDMYLPAVKIISDNVINRDVALYTKGAIVCHGGMLSVGHFNNADNVTVLDFSFGSTMLISNTAYRYVYLPTLSTMKMMLNTTTPFILPICLVAQYNNTENFLLKFQDNQSTLHFRNYNGGQLGTEISVGAGDVLQLLLIWDGTNYYAQTMVRNT